MSRSLLVTLLLLPVAVQAGDRIELQLTEWVVAVRVDDAIVARYVWNDEKTTRPYFMGVQPRGGTGAVTRNHPPQSGKDATDHDTMHPGLWLAFGDINGHDFWRNKARVEQVRLVVAPKEDVGPASFTAENRWMSSDGKSEVCREKARFQFYPLKHGWGLDWQSELTSSDHDLKFGHQEEMGLGVRMATPLAVAKGSGTITNDRGEKNEAGTWGKELAWLDYSGTLNDGHAGLLVVPLDTRCWAHSRDYGFMTLNPFPRPGTKPETTIAPRGKALKLRFLIYVHSHGKEDEVDLKQLADEITAAANRE